MSSACSSHCAAGGAAGTCGLQKLQGLGVGWCASPRSSLKRCLERCCQLPQVEAGHGSKQTPEVSRRKPSELPNLQQGAPGHDRHTKAVCAALVGQDKRCTVSHHHACLCQIHKACTTVVHKVRAACCWAEGGLRQKFVPWHADDGCLCCTQVQKKARHAKLLRPGSHILWGAKEREWRVPRCRHRA